MAHLAARKHHEGCEGRAEKTLEGAVVMIGLPPTGLLSRSEENAGSA